MVSVKRNIRPEEVRHRAQHVLFAEGKDKNAVDPKVLGALFDIGNIRIEPLGPSFSVRSVAEALYSYHPTYYFLIDRDHHTDEFVEQCWSNFPDPDKNNLLVWRKREIENYFLDPAYLFHSGYCEVSQQEMENRILAFARTRLYLDAANYVVISIREELKRNWINKFSNPADFPSRDKALAKLINTNEFEEYKNNVNQKVSSGEIEQRFNRILDEMLGDSDTLRFNTGKWPDMIQGKKVLSQVIHSGCFRVEATDGSNMSGREKLNAVIKDLLQKNDAVQPADFLELKRLITARMNGSHE